MFELMREMRWTWDEYQATPHYVRQVCWIFLMEGRRANNAAAERAHRSAQQKPGATEVRW